MRSLASAVSLWGRQLAVSVRGAVETPRPLCPARPRRGTRPGDATRGRDSRPRGHTHRKMFAAVLVIKARGHEAAQPGPEELVT